MNGKLRRSPRDELLLGEYARLPTLKAQGLRYVKRVLKLVGNDVTKAARILGIGRATLYRMVQGLAIETKGQRVKREAAELQARAEEAERLAWAGRKFKTL